MMAWFGAAVLKVERITGGDVTRHQLRDIPDIDALYFTMLNSNKRSLAINTKTPEGKQVMEKLIRDADVLVENFAPGAMDRMGLLGLHCHAPFARCLSRRLTITADNAETRLKDFDDSVIEGQPTSTCSTVCASPDRAIRDFCNC
jgi:hypothetical protein